MNSVQFIFALALVPLVLSQYQPTWESLDSRPLPSWYDEAKFGIFMHWGVYSVPSYGTEWFWYVWKQEKRRDFVEFMKENYPPNFEYQDFAPMFRAEFFDPDAWADLLTKSGARWVWPIIYLLSCEKGLQVFALSGYKSSQLVLVQKWALDCVVFGLLHIYAGSLLVSSWPLSFFIFSCREIDPMLAFLHVQKTINPQQFQALFSTQ